MRRRGLCGLSMGLSMGFATVVAATVVAIAGFARPAAAQVKPRACDRPPIQLVRYEEDYSFLSDPECRTDFWDPVKYVMLAGHPSMYLSLGADLRERFQFFDDPDWGLEPDDAYLLHRSMVHADVHPSERVRGFVQLTSNFAIGREGGPGPLDQDALDLHQAFADVRFEVRGAGRLTVRPGRQEIDYEGARLISTREGANVRLSFDGVRVMQQISKWRVDGFVVAPVATNPGVFDDGRVPGQLLWGVYGLGPVIGGALGLDAFYLGFDRQDAAFDQGTAHETRHSLGVRASGRPAAFDYDVELVYQLGSFGSGRIDAWMAASDAGYTLRSAALETRFGMQLNATSGDRDLGDPDLQTFNPLFPKASYFSDANLIGPLNHIDVHPAVTLRSLGPMAGLAVTLAYDAFWRQSLADGVYRISGALIASGRTSRARSVGSEIMVRVVWPADRHATFVASYSHFFAGPFLEDAGLSSDVDFLALWLSYRI